MGRVIRRFNNAAPQADADYASSGSMSAVVGPKPAVAAPIEEEQDVKLVDGMLPIVCAPKQEHTAGITPRTDANVYADMDSEPIKEWVSADFARELERENAELLAALETIYNLEGDYLSPTAEGIAEAALAKVRK